MSRTETPNSKPGTDVPDGAAGSGDTGDTGEEKKTGIETRSTILIDPDGTVTVSHFTRDFMDMARTLNPDDRRWDKFEQ